MKTLHKAYLVINPGSTSTCYNLFYDDKELAYAYFLNRYTSCEAQYRSNNGEKKHLISKQEFEQSGLLFLNYLRQLKLISNDNDIACIGFRVVAPGTFFTEHRKIDENYVQMLKKSVHLDLLHIAPLIKQIETFKKLLPNAIFYGISDSAFHTTMPQIARIYALPAQTRESLDIRRFGYHGIACSSIMRKIEQSNSQIPENIIVCHLGGGTSITAIKNGKSIDTSMGYSPLEGLPMATRSGNIDPNAVMSIMQAYDFTPEQLIKFLYTECGLLALSQKSGDMRQIEAAYNNGDKNSTFAIDYYAYTITKVIGAYATILHGIDLLVLTGGISFHMPLIRKLICEKLTFLNVALDEQRNSNLIAKDGFIEISNSQVKIAVMAPDEEQEMYKIVKDI